MRKAFTDPAYGRRNRVAAGVLAALALALGVLTWRTIGFEAAALITATLVAFILVGPYVRSLFYNPHAAFWLGSEPGPPRRSGRRAGAYLRAVYVAARDRS